MERGLRTGLEPGAADERDQGKTPLAGSGDLGPECCKRNGLINTRNLMVETKEGLVSAYSAPQYQGHVVSKDKNGTQDGRGPPQLLNPSALPQAIDPYYRPNLILYPESVLRAWGEGGDCCETTFIEEMTPASSGSAKDGIVFADGRLLDLSLEDAKIQTLSYDVDDDDDDFQELEVRYYIRSKSNVGFRHKNKCNYRVKAAINSYIDEIFMNKNACVCIIILVQMRAMPCDALNVSRI